MTRDQAIACIHDELDRELKQAEVAFETRTNEHPHGYLVPAWLHRLLVELEQEPVPRWHGKRLEPWNKDEIRAT